MATRNYLPRTTSACSHIYFLIIYSYQPSILKGTLSVSLLDVMGRADESCGNIKLDPNNNNFTA